MRTPFILIIFLAMTKVTMAQETPKQLQRINTIKLEITQLLYPNSFVMSYERATWPNQTFCVSGGYEELPLSPDISSGIYVKDDLSKSGFKAGAEYRFYLQKENKHVAPHGVYIGPYVSYHSFYNNREIEVTLDSIQESAGLQTEFRILNLGAELGYQFMINNRWAFDFVIAGPCLSNYYAEIKMNGEFTFDKDEVEDEILLKMLDRFPMLDNLISDKEVSSQGRFDSWLFGWRYSILIGYHFGKKKKQ